MKILLFIAQEPVPEGAVELVGSLARLTDSTVTLLYVPPGSLDEADEARTLARVKELLPGMDVEVHLHYDRATGRLVEEAQEETYDLVVLAMRQIGHLRRRLTGSRSRRVLRRGHRSVLVAKQSDPRIDRILVCTSGTDLAETVVATGARIAGVTGAQVTLLHVTGHIPGMYAGLPKIEESLEEFLASDTGVARHIRRGQALLSRHSQSVRVALRHGVVADEIIQESLDGSYDLIVVGASAPGGQLQSWLLGEVSWDIVERATCHVLVVKHARPGFEEESS